MASDFSTSAHRYSAFDIRSSQDLPREPQLVFGICRHLISRQRLREAQPKDRLRGLTDDDIQAVKCFALDYLVELAKASQQFIKQRIIANASVYFRQFYLVSNFSDYDPRSVSLACLYLASKVEEASVSAKDLFQIMKTFQGMSAAQPRIDMKGLLDMEMVVLEMLGYNLILYSPFRDLGIFLREPKLRILADFAWAALNDSYRTDVCLLYPPFLIAIAALNMAATACDFDLLPWLRERKVDPNQLANVVADLLYGYKKHNENPSPDEFLRLLELSSMPCPELQSGNGS